MFFSMRRVTLCDGKNTCTRAKWITERLQTHVLQLTSEALGPSAGIAALCPATRRGAHHAGAGAPPEPVSHRAPETLRPVCAGHGYSAGTLHSPLALWGQRLTGPEKLFVFRTYP